MISIITILMALLIGGITSALTSSKNSKQLSDLRQMFTGWTLYANQYTDQCLPGFLSVETQKNWKVAYRMNGKLEGFRIFAGSEVDILKDGALDFSDDVLSQLDYCVASVHNVMNLDEETMTRRIIRAMENPYVTMLGHMTGRLLLKRDAYAVNHAKIIDAAAETRTIIELNCSPKRLDMDWRWWHRARDKGVLCSINPDAHSTAQLQYLHYGILQARKGWLRKEDVVNTLSLEIITEFLAKPKAQR